MRHHTLCILERHPFLNRPLHPDKSYPILVFKEFANRPHPPVSKMVYVIYLTYAVFKIYQIPDNCQDILLGQR